MQPVHNELPKKKHRHAVWNLKCSLNDQTTLKVMCVYEEQHTSSESQINRKTDMSYKSMERGLVLRAKTLFSEVSVCFCMEWLHVL